MDTDKRLNYIGIASLLAQCSVMLGTGCEADEQRDSIDHALHDFVKLNPMFKLRSVLHRRELELKEQG